MTSWRGLVPRSWVSVDPETAQPPWRSPTSWSSATNAPSKNTSLKSDSSVIWRRGDTVTPGASMATMNAEMPLRAETSGSVRARHSPQSANWA